MNRAIHVFDNGVKVYDDHLNAAQRKRYNKRNVHEAEEEDIFIQIMRTIPANGCFVNVGSAIGYYCILAKKLSPRLTIHAVEPLKLHTQCFIENVALNDFSASEFFLHYKGLSDSEGSATFIEASYSSRILDARLEQQVTKARMKLALKMLLARFGLYNFIAPAKVTIETTTLDRLMENVGQSVDLLQMDVQGLEASVLKGGSNSLQTRQIKTFLIGTHSRRLHQECIDILRSNNYLIEYEEDETKEQPDGIIVGSTSASTIATGASFRERYSLG